MFFALKSQLCYSNMRNSKWISRKAKKEIKRAFIYWAIERLPISHKRWIHKLFPIIKIFDIWIGYRENQLTYVNCWQYKSKHCVKPVSAFAKLDCSFDERHSLNFERSLSENGNDRK